MMSVAAITIIVILILLSVFQLALIVGAPIGRFAWGGQHEMLPLRLRIGSVVSILIYAFMILIVVSKAGFAQIVSTGNFLNVSLWVVTGYLALGIVMNAISRSKSERNVMKPVVIVLTVCFFILAVL